MLAQRLDAHRGGTLELRVSRERHADRTDGRIAPEDGGVPPPSRALPGGGGEYSRGREVPVQELDGSAVAGVEQRLPIEDMRHLGHGGDHTGLRRVLI
jgi:hypothetical protein